MYQLARSGVSFVQPYRFWLDPNGAGIHNPRAIGGGCILNIHDNQDKYEKNNFDFFID
ncbi:hypothetical protein SDC9_115322 [bioreactor metagenome]|uniref:Uncharacterized protein n=1 Tax=bioreactor metagenome TaxID=1076179 RepID=A0A645BSI3_9ZZZZ